VEASQRSEESELPPAVVDERAACRCEWCGRPLSPAVDERDLSADVGRRVHRYLPRRYRVCDDDCRRGAVRFVRRHLALGPALWSLTVLSFLTALLAFAAILPPPLHWIALDPAGLVLLLGGLGLLGIITGGLVALLPYTFIARRPEGEPPVVPLRRTRVLNRALGLTMAAFSAIVLLRTLLYA
jgi:hypothetical protein